MSQPRFQLARLLLASTALMVLGTGRAANAQEEVEVEDAVVVQAQPVFMVNDQNFDQWIFGNVGGADRVRSRLVSLLTLKVEDVDRACRLSETQKEKLELAGRGDIKRFFDRVDEKRRKFVNVRHDQNQFQEIIQEIQPLQQSVQGEPFGDGSLFGKTLKKTLSGDQAARYAKAAADKRQFRYRAKVALAVAMLDNAVGFTAEQRRRFMAVLLEETKPPKIYSQYDYQVVMVQAARLPEEKLKPIFDDAQWQVLNRQFQQARGMEQFLRNHGFLPDAAPGANPAGPDPPAVRIRRGFGGR
jgi:hypothetical protein